MGVPAQADLAARCQPIELLVADVDGVLTDGVIALDDSGVETKHFYVQGRDGVCALAPGWQAGGDPLRPSCPGGRAPCRRAQNRTCAPGARTESRSVAYLDRRARLFAESGLFRGGRPGRLAGAPSPSGWPPARADAAAEVKDAAHLITQAAGGRGAVREVVEVILKSQGRWTELIGAAFAASPA